MRHIRLPGLWEHFQPVPGGDLDDEYCRIYRSVIEQCRLLKISITCDPCHNYGHYRYQGTGSLFWGRAPHGRTVRGFLGKVRASLRQSFQYHRLGPYGRTVHLPGPSVAAQSGAWKAAAQAAIPQSGKQGIKDRSGWKVTVIPAHRHGRSIIRPCTCCMTPHGNWYFPPTAIWIGIIRAVIITGTRK